MYWHHLRDLVSKSEAPTSTVRMCWHHPQHLVRMTCTLETLWYSFKSYRNLIICSLYDTLIHYIIYYHHLSAFIISNFIKCQLVPFTWPHVNKQLVAQINDCSRPPRIALPWRLECSSWPIFDRSYIHTSCILRARMYVRWVWLQFTAKSNFTWSTDLAEFICFSWKSQPNLILRASAVVCMYIIYT